MPLKMILAIALLAVILGGFIFLEIRKHKDKTDKGGNE